MLNLESNRNTDIGWINVVVDFVRIAELYYLYFIYANIVVVN